MKGLEALNKIAIEMELRGYNKPMEEFAIIEKELKALEIIHKYLDIDKLYNAYFIFLKRWIVIKEKERDLLREVLKNE